MSIKTYDLKLKVNEREAAAHLAHPEGGGPGVLVLHAWWGLKPYFKEVCDQLAEQGFTALAPDLRDGEIAGSIESAKELMERSDNASIAQVVEAARGYLLNQTPRKGDKIGVLGFSMGGSWALEIAANDPQHVAAVISFYGAGDTDFSKMKAKFLGHFCEEDEWEPEIWVRQMQGEMQAAGMQAVIHFYPEASHWFMETDRPEFNPAASALAWQRTYEFLKVNLLA